MKYIIKFLTIILIITMLSGCTLFKRDSMENITIITTIYPIEYTLRYLYGNNSIINSIYPDDTNVDEYKLTPKQIKDNSKKDLFVYLGNSNDSNTAVTFVNNNREIKLIDATFGMQYSNSIEELWLNPSNLLMISQNLKNGLSEYITNSYLIKEIENNYENLKLELSELDADLKLTIQNSSVTTIFSNSNALKHLEKYGLTVYVLDPTEDVYEKNLTILRNSIKNKSVKNIFILENTEVPKEVKELIDNEELKSEMYRNLKNIKDNERDNDLDYIDITKENLETLKKELY